MSRCSTAVLSVPDVFDDRQPCVQVPPVLRMLASDVCTQYSLHSGQTKCQAQVHEDVLTKEPFYEHTECGGIYSPHVPWMQPGRCWSCRVAHSSKTLSRGSAADRRGPGGRSGHGCGAGLGLGLKALQVGHEDHPAQRTAARERFFFCGSCFWGSSHEPSFQLEDVGRSPPFSMDTQTVVQPYT